MYLTRRYLFCILAIIGAFSSLMAQSTGAERPNVIFILTDDQRFDALGYAGNELIHTPEMDRLAEEGTYFSHAMVTTPICAASRASILSGVYERSHRFNFQTGDIQDDYLGPAYPTVLRENGYHTGFYGKYGVRYPHQDRMFDEYETYDRNNAYNDRRGYYYKTLGGDTVHLTRYTGQQGLDFVEKNAGGPKPFCLQLSFSAPHAHDRAEEQYFWQEITAPLLASTNIPAPALSAQKYFDLLPEPVRKGFNRKRWTWRYDTPEKYQHSVKGYYRMLSGIDLEIGKLRAKLEEKGIADNTVIILMGDNGYFLGERQLAGKWLMYDNSVRVPLIIHDPRAGQHVESDEMALNIDVPATILDLAGVAPPPSYQGQTLLPVVRGQAEQLSDREVVLIEHLWDFDDIPPSEGVRTKDWKYLRYVDDHRREELYHLKKDPLESNNLVDEPKHRGLVTMLRRQCNELIDRYSDDYSAAPQNLSLEFIRDPATVVLRDPEPEFAWVVPHGTGMQTAYQILVASSSTNLENNRGDVWDSKKVRSNQNVGIEYAGPALQKGRQYWWKVRVWDGANRLSRYAQAQQFNGPDPVTDNLIALSSDGAATKGDAGGRYLTSENIFQLHRVQPVLVEQRGDVTFVDFGKHGFANMELTHTARRDGELTIEIGEKLKNGKLDPEPGGHIRYQKMQLPVRKGTHTYTLPIVPDERNTKPLAVHLPDSIPVLMPFRYCAVAGAGQGLSKTDFTQLVYTSFWDEDASYFTSDNSVLNQVWELCRYSMKATSFANLYVDGDRERIPYEADAYLQQLSHYSTDREYAIGRRTIEYFMEYPTWPTEWQQHVPLMFHADYMYTGDTELIEKYYDDLKHKALLELVGEDDLVSSTRVTPAFMKKLGFGDRKDKLKDIVDWPPPNWQGNPDVPGERDGFVFMDNNTVINALFYKNMLIMSEFADLLGKTDEALEFKIRALKVKQAVNNTLLDRERGRYVDGEGTDHASVHANMFPLAFGMVPEAYRESVGAYIKSRGMACSVYGSQYLLEALYQAGMDDYALDLMADTTGKRNWYNMLREGSTVTMEAWGYQFKPNLDWNHAWGGTPANIIPRQLWGIQPKTPGYGVATIHPQLGDLKSTTIKVPTLRGPILGEYRWYSPRRQVYTITVPGNMVAEFGLDNWNAASYTHNGKLVPSAFGVIQLQPGEHQIEVQRNDS
ncbi:sulfatase-like hydrolase/transferase [Lewinella sp. 4G2]|uniref:sulfatase-like hydrolase/transferase n=1 Tax=Lewinella sp. 4G2 TaxID=1803372 RepID=UPI0007B49915|nr:sulfatase-like hydrolase/transferase [Lewinella sp. 4G2]OAV43136.1 acetylglucosamine-6-sulfatase [Lewinella sp. 4G2]